MRSRPFYSWRFYQWLSASVLLLLVAGCSSDVELGYVTGVVTLEGRPLSNVVVEFQPEKGGPSYGVTNDSGAYTMRFTRSREGAFLGTHKVKITVNPDSDGGALDKEARKALNQYNRKTKPTVVVQSGNNTFDFDLKRGGDK
jgi:hypothetical protein